MGGQANKNASRHVTEFHSELSSLRYKIFQLQLCPILNAFIFIKMLEDGRRTLINILSYSYQHQVIDNFINLRV